MRRLKLPHEAELDAKRFELKKEEASRRLALSKVDQEIEQERIAVANTENAMLGAFKKSAGRVEEPENR